MESTFACITFPVSNSFLKIGKVFVVYFQCRLSSQLQLTWSAPFSSIASLPSYIVASILQWFSCQSRTLVVLSKSRYSSSFSHTEIPLRGILPKSYFCFFPVLEILLWENSEQKLKTCIARAASLELWLPSTRQFQNLRQNKLSGQGQMYTAAVCMAGSYDRFTQMD